MNIFQHLERAATFFPDKDAILFEGALATPRKGVRRAANG